MEAPTVEFRQLVIFREVARHLNFTKAATALNYAQSNITTQVRVLEASLGVSLFQRLGNRVVLTEAGQRLLEYTDRILGLVEEARADLNAEHIPAAITIGAAETILAYRLPPVIRRFREQFPQVELSFVPGSCGSLREGLQSGAIQVAFLVDEPEEGAQLTFEPLGTEPLVLVARTGHPMAGGAPIAVADLGAETLLVTDKTCGYRRFLDQALATAGVQPRSLLQFTNLEAMKQCAVMGVGLAFLPEVAVRGEIERGLLLPVRLELGPMGIQTHSVRHRTTRLSPLLQAFVALTREELSTESES
jgi:DNA-binding transcriptional LysR family regulator